MNNYNDDRYYNGKSFFDSSDNSDSSVKSYLKQQNTPRNVIIRELILKEVTGQNFQYIRPYVSNPNGDSIDRMEQYFDTTMPISPHNVAKITGNFITRSAQVYGSIDIANGWNERRFIFLMIVDYIDPNIGVSSEIITGYTDSLDYSSFGTKVNLSPDLRFFINSILQLRTFQQNTGAGLVKKAKVINANHVFSTNPYRDSGADYRLFSLDSQRVLGKMQDLNNEYYNMVRLDEEIQNTPIMAPRTESSPSHYASNILEPIRTSMRQDEYNQEYSGINLSDVFSLARTNVMATPSESVFMNLLVTNYLNSFTSEFTWKNLLDLDPNVDNVAKVVFSSNIRRDFNYNSYGYDYVPPEASQPMDGNTIEVVAATILGSAVPSILMKYGISTMTFTATNETLDSSIQLVVTGIQGFVDQDLAPYIDVIINDIKHTVLMDISQNNRLTFKLQMSVMVIGETSILISFDGSPIVPFSIPTFCDALFNPTITPSSVDIESVAKDFIDLSGVINNKLATKTIYPSNSIGLEVKGI